MTSLYIHIPFCNRKCLFCSFVVAIGQAHRVEDYLSALDQEAKHYRGIKLSTVYIGGGTPSFLTEDQLKRLRETIDQNFDFKGGEFTLEANPESIDPAKLKTLKSIGVNRLSLGIQSFNDRYLKFLGRGHDHGRALEAFHNIREAGFNNVSVDLMFSFPGQTRQELEADLQQMTKLKSEHVSLYSLTIEEHSRFFVRGVHLDDEEKQAEDYLLIMRSLEEAGLKQYEVSNFARDGFESRHNLNYWQGGNYIGIGVGAHSHKDGRRWWNSSTFPDYLSRCQKGEDFMEGHEDLSVEQRFNEALLFGLRMNEGIELKELQQRFSHRLSDEAQQMVKSLIEEGFLISSEGRLKTALKGRLVLDEISARLI